MIDTRQVWPLQVQIDQTEGVAIERRVGIEGGGFLERGQGRRGLPVADVGDAALVGRSRLELLDLGGLRRWRCGAAGEQAGYAEAGGQKASS